MTNSIYLWDKKNLFGSGIYPSLGKWLPSKLFANGEVGAWYDPSDSSTLFQDAAGTTPAGVGDPVGLMLDKSQLDGNHASQSTSNARPTLMQDDDNKFYLQNDEIDDILVTAFTNLGANCTVGYVTASEVHLLEDQTISGDYSLPATDLYGIVIIDRALSLVEKVALIRYLASKVDGVKYGAEIDRLTLIAMNAVDVFVYDTAKDSDGGAWRTGALAQASSWYSETLNTANRGSRREFPAVAVIVAEAAKVTIYDGDDPSLPMWMVFNSSANTMPNLSSSTIKAVSLRNGLLAVGCGPYDLHLVDFIKDAGTIHNVVGYADYKQSIANRDTVVAATYYTDATKAIVDRTVNDVAMTVLPDAPIDAATGLPVPTIYVGTGGGLSKIADNGLVYDLAYNESTGAKLIQSVDTDGDRVVVANSQGTVVSFDGRLLTSDQQYFSGITHQYFYSTSVPALKGSSSELDRVEAKSDGFARNGTTGFVLAAQDFSTQAKGMVAYITSTYNTGWMNGGIKGAFLADTDDTDLVGGTDADRSVNGNDLTVNGTVTRSPVATGAELVAYSGFSASNYLEQPYNADLDFGTGDFCVMGWCYPINSTGTDMIVDRSNSGGTRSLYVVISSGAIGAYVGSAGIVLSPSALPNSAWSHFVVTRRGGILEVYQNGVRVISSAVTSPISGTDDATKVGYGNFGPFPGSLALLRISATAPTAEQIAKIYNDEKVLFQENAACTLYGTSDAVTALAHDPDTGLLHVGTSAGRSVFDGLERLNNTTTSVSRAISASGGLVISK